MKNQLNEEYLSALRLVESADSRIVDSDRVDDLRKALEIYSCLNEKVSLYGNAASMLLVSLLRSWERKLQEQPDYAETITSTFGDTFPLISLLLAQHEEEIGFCACVENMVRHHLLVSNGIDPNDPVAANKFLTSLSQSLVLPANPLN